MSDPLASALDRYDYVLPKERIAQAPVTPRDASKLLVYDRATGETAWTRFRRIGDYLPAGCVLVLNQTKVIPARLFCRRPTGGMVALLSLGADGRQLRALSNKRLHVGEFLTLQGKKGFSVHGVDGNQWLLAPTFPIAELQRVLDQKGTMPLPPYIKHTPLTPAQQRARYQSVFARQPGSIAAPTASLHFTHRLLEQVRKRGVTLATLTLHVHLGTFAPLTEDQWKSGHLHEERYVIPPKTVRILEAAKRDKRAVITVGTTALRALESAADARGRIIHPKGDTTLFIREGYRFRMTDGLITNFHVPRSSLLMLVSAFAGREVILDLYRQALAQDFRFFSFGDAMFLR